MCITKEAIFLESFIFFLHLPLNIFLILSIFFFIHLFISLLYVPIFLYFTLELCRWNLTLRIHFFFLFLFSSSTEGIIYLSTFQGLLLCDYFLFLLFPIPDIKDSHSGTDIKLVLLNGFLVMHVHKASFTFNLGFCFPLVTHFAASVFIL